MKTAEIRRRFIEFFRSKGHQIVPSSSLVPENDPTLLFTNAGMVQFKDVFLGKDQRPYKRAATVQKCVRAGGKHNDLENVGFTARHHTFFEMLGNFSFGDYFKEDAIKFAYEFVTKELKMPLDRIYVTVFRDDDEAAKIWETAVGFPKERIYRFDEKDNFWAMGDTGPCGPCSEIFYDRGAKYSCGKPTCGMGCDCDRYIEFWNLVFMQYERDKSGQLKPLPKPSVDTGAGLERLAAILQDKPTNYDADGFEEIMTKTGQLLKKAYTAGTEDAFYFRVIADHSRATAFLIADGVLPSNEGRGYVLRRIIRRAIRYGKKLGAQSAFLYQTCQYVIDQMAEAYPELQDKRALIAKLVQAEEEQFLKTLERGLTLLDEEMAKVRKGGTLTGEVAFKMYDTYGFPLDLTRVICTENGLTVDEKGFEQSMALQRAQSRKNWKGTGDQAVHQVYYELAEKLRTKKELPQFVGYEHLEKSAKCVGLILSTATDKQLVDFATVAPGSDDVLEAVFAVTPFYAESGGQAGDKGRVTGEGFAADVIDVYKPVPDLIVTVLHPQQGSIRVGATYSQETQEEVRRLTMRNHTATHLLHGALRSIVGDHVKQAGSLVNADMLRFDFSHYQALTPAEMQALEQTINEQIWQGIAVSKKEMAKDAAIAAGAIAFFGEKYGDKVRVVSVGDVSVELCGGTHVDNTADIALFKIISESSVAAGVRRIVAYTSKKAYEYLTQQADEYADVKGRFKAVSLPDLNQKLDKLQATEKDLRKQLEKFSSVLAAQEVDELLAQARDIKGAKVIVKQLAQGDVKKLRDMGDMLKNRNPRGVHLLGVKDAEQNKAFLLAAVGKDMQAKLSAQALIQELAPMIEGRGGGKPDMAQAGGSNMAGLEQAMQQASAVIERLLG